MNELLNRKSASRSARVPFHVVSLIPRAGFQKRFIVSVLQSYAPFNVGVFKRWRGGFSQNMCALHQPAAGPRSPGRRSGNVASRLPNTEPGWMWPGAWVDADGGLGGYGWEPGWIRMGAWENVDGRLDGYGWGPGWMRTGAWEDVDGRLGRYGLGPGCCEQLPLFSHKLRLTCAWSSPWSVLPGSQHPSHQVLHLGRRTLVFACLHTLGLTHQHPGLLLVFSPYTDST